MLATAVGCMDARRRSTRWPGMPAGKTRMWRRAQLASTRHDACGGCAPKCYCQHEIHYRKRLAGASAWWHACGAGIRHTTPQSISGMMNGARPTTQMIEGQCTTQPAQCTPNSIVTWKCILPSTVRRQQIAVLCCAGPCSHHLRSHPFGPFQYLLLTDPRCCGLTHMGSLWHGSVQHQRHPLPPACQPSHHQPRMPLHSNVCLPCLNEASAHKQVGSQACKLKCAPRSRSDAPGQKMKGALHSFNITIKVLAYQACLELGHCLRLSMISCKAVTAAKLSQASAIGAFEQHTVAGLACFIEKPSPP